MITNTLILDSQDLSESFVLDTDGDGVIRAVLSQIQDDNKKAIAYLRRSVTKSERSQCVMKKRLPAKVAFVKHFQHFLNRKLFTIRTNNSCLRLLLKFKIPKVS